MQANSQLLLRWLENGSGCVAQAIRVKLASESLDAAKSDHADPILNILHGRELCDASTVRHDGLRLIQLAENVADFLVHDEPAPWLVRDELVAFVESLGMELTDAGCPHNAPSTARRDPITDANDMLAAKLEGAPDEDMFEGADRADEGEGTGNHPLEMPRRSRIPISEFKAKGYMALAFPTLFPNGRGHFDEPRDYPLKWDQWSQHLMRFYDGRFAQHRRFPHFMLNTHERHVAIQRAGVFVNRDPQAGRLTYGQLRAMSKESRESVFRRLSSYGATLRNTPAFFKQRRYELRAMIEQLGDPHVFATNSHADTHCPYLHRFIMAGARIEPGSERDPFAPPNNSSERYKRRLANVVAYPHLTAQFFHLKTELFFLHIGEALGCEVHWCRYEWQSRGSTHAHYFLWLKDTPDVLFLDAWVQEELRSLGDGAMLTDDVVNELVTRLNERAIAASEWEPDNGWPMTEDGLLAAINGSIFDQKANNCPCDCHSTGTGESDDACECMCRK